MLNFLIFLLYLICFLPLILRIKNYIKRGEKKFKHSIILSLIFATILTIILILFRVYTEALWFSSLGYVNRYWKVIIYNWLIFFIGFGLTYFFTWGNMRSIVQIKMIPGERIKKYVPIALAILMGVILREDWQTILLYFYSVKSGITDPIFQKDISFYLFNLPFLHCIVNWFLTFIFFLLIIIIPFYFSVPLVHLGFTHAKYLGCGIIWCFMAKAFIAPYGLLYSTRAPFFGASYTDVHAQLIAYRIFLIVAGGALIFLSFLRRRRKIWLFFGIFAFLSIIILKIYSALFQYFVVRPNELDRERPYIENNIKYTRIGYNLQNVKEKNVTLEELTPEIINNSKDVIDNIRLWDWRALIFTYKQMQEIRPYYEFSEVDIERYWIKGKYRQVMLSPREINIDKLPLASKNWINEKFKYTHGYGVCMSLVSEFLGPGSPSYLIKDFPPSSEFIRIDTPQIYFGEKTFSHIFVNTLTEEFDYPSGDKNVYCKYKGRGGIPLSNFLRKLSFALRLDGFRLLLSKYLTKDSRIIFRRQIKEMLNRLAPFLKYDSDPYIVIANNKLYWIIDAYTVSNKFPYSHRTNFLGDTINYVRNSVKCVIDAYNGDTKFYIFDDKDPIIKTYSRIFPGMFLSKDYFPKELLSHIRYPEDLFTCQSNIYAIYHMTDPDVFYNKEDVWAIPQEKYIDKMQPVIPYYIISKIDKDIEFLLMLPFTPLKKDNMIAWFCARCDQPNYGELLVYKFTKEKLIYGHAQVEAKVDQHPEMSQLFTLWGQHGSQVIRGNLLVIPLFNSLLYIEPVYLQAVESKIPEIKKIIVSTGENVAWGDNFSDAVKNLFVEYKAKEEYKVEERKSLSDYLHSALDALIKYKKLMGDGKFSSAGEKLEELEKTIKEAIKLEEKK